MLYRSSIINGQFSFSDPSGSPGIDIYILPDEAERTFLIETLKLDPRILDSVVDPGETPRIEFEQNHISVIMKYPRPHSEEDKFHFSIHTFGIFLFSPGRVVYVFNEKLPFTTRLHGSREGTTVERVNTVQDILLRSLSQSIRRFEMYLKRIGKCKDELKKNIDRPKSQKSLTDMFTLRESLIYYIDALRGNGHLIERLITVQDRFGFTPENVELLKDYAIENQQFLEQAQVYSQLMSDLMDTCNSVIGNHLNSIMKNMNSLVLAITIPAFFTGLGGMSEFTLFTKPYLEWYVSYPLFLGSMALLFFLIYWLLQRYYRT